MLLFSTAATEKSLARLSARRYFRRGTPVAAVRKRSTKVCGESETRAQVLQSKALDMNKPNPTALLLAAAALSAVAGCSNDDFGSAVALADGRKQALAPIESAEIVVRESAPPQYAVKITSGLPNGCAKFDRIDVVSNGKIVDLKVWNTLPAENSIACTMIYGTTANTVNLAGHFERGRTYDVRVNGETKATFTAK
jgi:uncharacterized OsmC-like protein